MGPCYSWGTVADVVDQVHGSRTFCVSLIDEDRSYRWEFVGERRDMSMAVRRVRVDGEGVDRPETLRHLLRPSDEGDLLAARLKALTYLTAERLGPRQVYELLDSERTYVVGPTGEHAASILYSGGDKTVLQSLVIQGFPPTRQRQTEARMRNFFPSCEMVVERVPMANAVTLGVRTSRETDFLRPVHTGFGVTQVLPIVVAALSARPDDLLLVENPEVHLHPAGQAAMGRFMAEVASAGVQVVLETHSDHVLNGVRRAVKDQVLSASGAALHFFRSRSEAEATGESQVQSPQMDAHGNIDAWPNGFFDQFDRDMNYFADWD